MKSSYTWTIIVIALLCINSAMLVMMWKEKRDARPSAENSADVKTFLTKELSFTPRQVFQFDSLRNLHRMTMDSLNDKVRRLRDQLFDGLTEPKANAAVANDITRQIGSNLALIDQATYDHFKQLQTLLNYNQQRKFDNIIKQVLHMMAQQAPPPPRGERPPGGPEGMPPMPPPGN
jgi:hypothetical protein